MYSRVFLLLIIMLFTACGTDKKGNSKLAEEGKELVDSNDCKTCHHTSNKIMGPTYSDIGKKYQATNENVAMLAERIIKGGSGNWGEIPMNAHTDLSQESAKKMAQYVLSLSNVD